MMVNLLPQQVNLRIDCLLNEAMEVPDGQYALAVLNGQYALAQRLALRDLVDDPLC